MHTFVKLQAKFVLDEALFYKVVLVKLRTNDISQVRWSCEGICHSGSHYSQMNVV